MQCREHCANLCHTNKALCNNLEINFCWESNPRTHQRGSYRYYICCLTIQPQRPHSHSDKYAYISLDSSDSSLLRHYTNIGSIPKNAQWALKLNATASTTRTFFLIYQRELCIINQLYFIQLYHMLKKDALKIFLFHLKRR